MHSLISGNPERMSSLLTMMLLTLLSETAYLSGAASNQPQRRWRPVVVPNSLPFWSRWLPVSSSSCVGNGPLPTRVELAFMTPMTWSIWSGPIPAPVHAPPATGLLEVTYG